MAQAEKLLKEERNPALIQINSKQDQSRQDLFKSLDFSSILKPSIYRVATQNDGLKTYMMLRGDPAASFYYKGKAMFPWMDLDLLHLRTTGVKKENLLLEGVPGEGYSAILLAGEKAAAQHSRYTAAPGLGTFTYTLSKGYPMVLEVIFDLDPELPELPKVGLLVEIPSSYKEISWFGLGPDESYPDRLAGAFLGRYKLAVADFEVPYVVPQENGNRSGVRNFTLINEDVSKNITIRSDKPINIGCSRYSQENMWASCHTYELNDLSQGPDGHWFLAIDIAQRGVGTATCGPDTREEYRIRPGIFKMKLYIS